MNLNHESVVVKQSFEIDYAVFFNRTAAINRRCTNPDSRLTWGRNFAGGRNGAWLSSSSSTTSLFLFTYTSCSPLVLLISLDSKIREEHLVTMLHLSWPQISDNLTPTGSRVVVASYKDSAGEIQKFTMHFLDSSQSLLFIDTLKKQLPGSTFNAFLCEIEKVMSNLERDQAPNSQSDH